MDYYLLKLNKSKLKAINNTSSLMAGFAMVAMVELSLEHYGNYKAESSSSAVFSDTFSNSSFLTDNQSNHSIETSSQNPEQSHTDLIPEPLLAVYVSVTCLLVGVNLIALMISTCILPQVDATSEQMEFERQIFNLDKIQEKNKENITNESKKACSTEKQNRSDKADADNDDNEEKTYLNSDFLRHPHQKFHKFIEFAWICSTVIGIFLLLVEIALICFIKFYPISMFVSLSGAVVMTPILFIFIFFTMTFYKKVADYKLNVTKQFLEHVDRNLIPLHEEIV